MTRTLIIDDERNNSELISNLLQKFCKNIEVCGIADSVQSGYELINLIKPDLIFLDIKMPDGSGFDLLSLFPKIEFKVVFITAHEEFALKAFQVSAIDYLLKPISPQALIASVTKANQLLSKEEINDRAQFLLTEINKDVSKRRLTLKTQERIYSVNYNEIVRFESDGSYTSVFFSDGKKLVISKLIKEFEDLLSEHDFFRVHQSHLINMEYFYCFEKSENQIRMKDDSIIPVSTRKKERVLSVINAL